MPIRMLAAADITTAVALVRDVFMEFEAPDYSEEGIAHFMAYIEPAALCGLMESGDLTLWGEFIEDRLRGVIASRRGEHISLLFVHRNYHRRGIATRLFGAVLNHFSDPNTVTVNASPYGYMAYRRMGFTETAPQTTRDGITFIPMIYHRPGRNTGAPE